MGNADASVDSDKEDVEDYSPTPAYKLVQATLKPWEWSKERKLLWEVVELFLGDCIALRTDMTPYLVRKVVPGSIATLEKQLTTKLDRNSLTRKVESIKRMIQQVNCSTGCIIFIIL